MEKYSHMQREELLAEKELVKRRLAEFSTPALTSTENVHGPEKLLTHWDYVMKEMVWIVLPWVYSGALMHALSACFLPIMYLYVVIRNI